FTTRRKTMKIKIFFFTLLLCCVTLISCGNSETGGGETSALSPIDTTVTIPETAYDTTTPEQTTVSPETTSTPETTVLQEPPTTKTPEVTETTPVEETTIPETTAPSYNYTLGFKNSEEISGTFKIYSAVLKTESMGSTSKLIKNKEQLDNFNWGKNTDMYATTNAFPVSLNDVIKKFDETFFENNYLVIDYCHDYNNYTVGDIKFVCKDDNYNKLHFYYNVKKTQAEPINKEQKHNSWYVFVEIPKNLCDENTTAEAIPARLMLFYCNNETVSIYAALKYISYYDPSYEYILNRIDLSVYPDSFFETLFQSEEYKRYLLIQRDTEVQYYGSEDEGWVPEIDELLKHCK
ncbi:MAG: hypothetical protein IJN17_05815, partial [Clostridia bacterium]|nr:hypothetical protein [Clostridia bacterium]